MDLQTYVLKHLNAIILPVSQEAIIPGAVLEAEWEKGTLYTLKKIFSLNIYKQQYTIKSYKGLIWKYCHYDPINFKSTIVLANIIADLHTQNFKIINSILLPQYNIDIFSLFESDMKCNLTINEIKARILLNPEIMLKVYQDFNNNTFISNYCTGDLVVSECYYATKLKWEFDKSLNIRIILDYLKQLKLQDNYHYKYDDHHVVEMSGQPTVPFAVRGLWLNK
jgi:hypothetical protein